LEHVVDASWKFVPQKYVLLGYSSSGSSVSTVCAIASVVAVVLVAIASVVVVVVVSAMAIDSTAGAGSLDGGSLQQVLERASWAARHVGDPSL
jgi:hypothetical protein